MIVKVPSHLDILEDGSDEKNNAPNFSKTSLRSIPFKVRFSSQGGANVASEDFTSLL